MFQKYYILVYFCAIFYLSVEVDSQTCERRLTFIHVVRETYLDYHIVSYHGQCYYGCIKTQKLPLIKQRYVPKEEVKIIKFCCSGYIGYEMRKVNSSEDSEEICAPVCKPACQNGECTSPGVCTCHSGYKLDPENNHNCLPACENGCHHGTCAAPNICICNIGYTLVNGTCQPVCTEPCRNSTCAAPETCECLPGYRKSQKNQCEPYCSNGCINGSCVAPETCRCNPGWELTESKTDPLKKVCKPMCITPCDNGNCVAPNVCECSPTYTEVLIENASYACVPKCLLGWEHEGRRCLPQCSSCDNGTCVVPNICECQPGYHIYLRANKTLNCIPCVSDFRNESSSADEINEISSTSRDDLHENISEYPALLNHSYGAMDYYDEYDLLPDEDAYVTYDLEPKGTVVSSDVSSKDPVDKDDHGIGDSMKNTWIQEHWASIFIPLLIIMFAAMVMLLILRWTPIIVYFKGRSYVVEGDPLDNTGQSYAFQDIQISSTNENEIKCV